MSGAAHQFVLQQLLLILEQFTERFVERFKPAHGVFRFFIVDLLRVQLLFEVSGGGLLRRRLPIC